MSYVFQHGLLLHLFFTVIGVGGTEELCLDGEWCEEGRHSVVVVKVTKQYFEHE